MIKSSQLNDKIIEYLNSENFDADPEIFRLGLIPDLTQSEADQLDSLLNLKLKQQKNI